MAEAGRQSCFYSWVNLTGASYLMKPLEYYIIINNYYNIYLIHT